MLFFYENVVTVYTGLGWTDFHFAFITSLIQRARLTQVEILSYGHACHLCFLTLSEPASSSLLSDFQPVLPLGSFSF